MARTTPYHLRITALRQALDAADMLSRHLADTDPDQAIAILDYAIRFDPYEETTDRRLIAIHHRLGQPVAAACVIAAMTDQLDTIGETSASALEPEPYYR